MRTVTRVYVGTVASLAIAWAILLWRFGPPAAGAGFEDALYLCALAIAAEFLRFQLPQSAAGSMGFIPYFAAAIIVPTWESVAAVVLVKAVVELSRGNDRVKSTLNVSSRALMECAAVTVYLALHGQALGGVANATNLTDLARRFGWQAFAAFAAALFLNNIVVTAAIALNGGRSVRKVLHHNQKATIGLDFLAAPVVFGFAWVYVAFGPIAAGTVWIPLLGLRQVQSTSLELERTNEELLELMVRSLEARDAYTSGHSRRVQHYSQVIARAIGLSDRHVAQISTAALLHDVGKIHEKYAPVLAKQDKLTAEEWAIIQDHPADGAELVATMTRLRDIVPAIRHHHENWDGSGYPDGLVGEAIPLASRIIRFADTIDAMTTERPYRAPLTEAQVRSEIIRCRQTQFDPSIADKLLSSSLWATLFAPTSEDRAAVRLSVVSNRTTTVARRRSREVLGA